MRFNVASISHAQVKAKLLKELLGLIGHEHTLTRCQACVARCLGYESWAELKSSPQAPASPLDEDAGIDVWRARIERQCRVVGEDFSLDPHAAAGVAKVLRLTSRSRADDKEAGLDEFTPRPRGSVPAVGIPVTGKVSVWLMQWTEHERGWGNRPDGYSVHASPQAAKDYVAAYWARMPNAVQDEFSAPETDVVEVRVASDHPVAVMLAEGRHRVFPGPDSNPFAEVWPKGAGGWQRVA